MKLTIRDDSKNYACTVVKLPPKQIVTGLDNLVKVTIFGNDVLVKKDADESILYLFFPAECCINKEYLYHNNEFRHSELNKDKVAKGFFEDTGRVKSIKFKGVISTGYLAPTNALAEFDFSSLKEGDEFTTIDGWDLCKKYKIVHQSASTKESRLNKKLKRFDKLVPNQFRFHQDTSQLAKHLHLFDVSDIVVISSKWHGTSAVFSNVLINKKLSFIDRMARWIGVKVEDKIYDNIYASRSVIKNQYINEGSTAGFYNEDIWGMVHKEVKEKIESGITVYGEIVGYLQSGKGIQKGYDYGCQDGEHKFLVYRITYTKPDGNVIEFSWQQIKDYCKKYQLDTVKELYFGALSDFLPHPDDLVMEEWQEEFFCKLQKLYLEQDCKYCINKVPAEGICVRIDGREGYMTFKLKSKRFLEKESKELDKGEVNIEDDATTNNM